LSIPPSDDLLAAERHWIRTCCPRHNKVHNPSPDHSAEAWGTSPGAYLAKVPGEYGEALQYLHRSTGVMITAMIQVALERYFRGVGLPFEENWPAFKVEPLPFLSNRPKS
jgi:hypothetical protein